MSVAQTGEGTGEPGEPVRIAQAGLGRIGGHHARNLVELPETHLAAVVDADAELAGETSRRLGVPARTWEQVLADPDVEAVLVATPTPLHATMVEQAAAAGKHVYCEKPLSLDQDAARRAASAAAAAGVKLQVGFHRRFDPDFAHARHLVDAGELGEVRLFRATCRDMHAPTLEYLRGSGGIFADVTLHDFDVARWLVGEVAEVYAAGSALSDPAGYGSVGDVDTAVVTLRFASGALGVVDNTREAGYGYDCAAELVGSSATARIGWERPHQRHGVQLLTEARAHAEWVGDFIERFATAYRESVRAFAHAVRHDTPVQVGAADAAAALTLAQAARDSWQRGVPVKVPPVSGA